MNPKGKRFSEKRKAELVEAWKKSGTTLKAFAKKNKVHFTTLSRWANNKPKKASKKVSSLNTEIKTQENKNLRGAIIHIIIQDMKERLENQNIDFLIKCLKKQVIG